MSILVANLHGSAISLRPQRFHRIHSGGAARRYKRSEKTRTRKDENCQCDYRPVGPTCTI